MKLSEDVLLEIVDIVRTGLTEQKDVSDLLRDLDVDIVTTKLNEDGSADKQDITLSLAYKARKGRVV